MMIEGRRKRPDMYFVRRYQLLDTAGDRSVGFIRLDQTLSQRKFWSRARTGHEHGAAAFERCGQRVLLFGCGLAAGWAVY